MLVCSKKKVHPVCGARKHALSAGRCFRRTPPEQNLLPAALQIKPPADGAGRDAVQTTTERNHRVLDWSIELKPAAYLPACAFHELQFGWGMTGIEEKHGVVGRNAE